MGIGLNLICKSEDIDYSLFNMDEDVPYFFQLGDSNKLRLGDPVKMIGYSDFSKGDSWDVISTSVRKTSRLFGHPLYLVDKNVFHGASGGIVLDKNDQIIGLICAGIASMDLPANNSKQGFIPINTVLQDIEQQGF